MYGKFSIWNTSDKYLSEKIINNDEKKNILKKYFPLRVNGNGFIFAHFGVWKYHTATATQWPCRAHHNSH